VFADYFNGDKFIFVNKSNNTNIKLSPKILFVKDFAKRYTKEEMRWNKRDMPDFMKKNPLSYDHVKALAEYCNEKKMQIAQLLNAMGFDGELNGDNNEFGSALNLYLAAGAQNIFNVNDRGSATSSYTEIEIRCDAVQACQLNTSVKKLTLRKVCSGGGSYSNNYTTVHMMVFQPR